MIRKGKSFLSVGRGFPHIIKKIPASGRCRGERVKIPGSGFFLLFDLDIIFYYISISS